MSIGKKDMWNYAIMTKDAKEQGGPERYIEAISADGRRTGRKQMIPVTILALVAGAAMDRGIKYLKKQSEKRRRGLKEAVEKITAGIKEYGDINDKTELSVEEKTSEVNLLDWQDVDKPVVVHFTDGDSIIGNITSIDDEDESGLGEDGLTIYALDGRIVGIGQSEINRIEIAPKELITLERRFSFIRREIANRYEISVINNKTRFKINDALYIDILVKKETPGIVIAYANGMEDAVKERFINGKEFGINTHPMTMLKGILDEINDKKMIMLDN